MARKLLFAALASSLLVACASTPEPKTPAANDVEVAEDAPLPDPSARIELLKVPGHAPAVVDVPAGWDPKPLVVIAHGPADRPEWRCEAMQKVLDAFVLCPRGRRVGARVAESDTLYAFPDASVLEGEVLAALHALGEKHGDRLQGSSALYVAIAQSADESVTMLPRLASTFPRAILVDGGFDAWDVDAAESYRRGGGERVVFTCVQEGCAHSARRNLPMLLQGGIQARVAYARTPGLDERERMDEGIRRALPWILAEVPPAW